VRGRRASLRLYPRSEVAAAVADAGFPARVLRGHGALRLPPGLAAFLAVRWGRLGGYRGDAPPSELASPPPPGAPQDSGCPAFQRIAAWMRVRPLGWS